MKTIFRTLGLGAALAAIFAVGSVRSLAQEACADVDGMNALYETVTGSYKSNDIPTLQKAIDSGKQFVEKYGACEPAKVNAGWVSKNMPKWEDRLAALKVDAVRGPILKRFDTAIQSKNWDDAYAAGDEFMAKFPNDPAAINVEVTLATIGYQEAFNKNNKFAANGLKFAKVSLDALKNGNPTAKPSGGYGSFQFECANKAECISLLTYATGYLTYFGQNNKQGAMPFFYETTKLPGTFAKYPATYGVIGDYYKETVVKLSDELKTKIAAQNEADADDVKAKKEADIKQTIGLLNGYAERAMDAYSRAYDLTKNDPKTKAYADNIYKQIQALYTVRFQKQEGLDAWIGSAVAKPFPDPTSTVTPVNDPDASTGTTGGEAGTAMGTANGSGLGTPKGTGMGAANGTGVGAAKGIGAGAPSGSGIGSSAKTTTAPAKTIKPRR